MPEWYFSAWHSVGVVRVWTRRRYWHKGPSDLHFIVVGAALVASAGIGLVAASQIEVVLGYAGRPPEFAALSFVVSPIIRSACFAFFRKKNCQILKTRCG
jgi:hypothetical protein